MNVINYKTNLRCVLYVLIILALLVLVGCSKSSYDLYKTNFNVNYYKVASNIDIEHTYDSIKKLQTEENKKLVNEMKIQLDNIKSNLPKSKKKDYEELQKQYDGIVFLKDSFNKWDSLTTDEERRINTEMWWAYKLYRDYKNSNK